MKTRKYKVVNWLNYDPNDHPGEKTVGESMTIPDEAISIKELLEKWTMGYDVERKPTYYSDSDDFDDVDPTQSPDFDLSDVQAERNRIIEKIEGHKARKQNAEMKAENGNGTSSGSVADGTQPADV